MTSAVRTSHWRRPEFDAQSPGLHHRWCVLIPAISTEQVMALEDDITTLAVLVQGMLDESGDQTGFDAKGVAGRWVYWCGPSIGTSKTHRCAQ